MGKTKTGKTAVAFSIIAFLFIFISFVTPYWLETDGKLQNPKFIRIGLWQVCFNGLEEIHHWYDPKFYGCWWVFEEEYYIIHDLLLPGFFVATQFFFTLSFTLLLIASFLVALYTCCSKDHDRFVLLLFVIGSDMVLAAISGTLAVIIFGARGDGRDWLPNWEHNEISWSYALAVFGVVFLYLSGILFLVEGRVHRKRQKREREAAQSAYHMEPRKAAHTVPANTVRTTLKKISTLFMRCRLCGPLPRRLNNRCQQLTKKVIMYLKDNKQLSCRLTCFTCLSAVELSSLRTRTAAQAINCLSTGNITE